MARPNLFVARSTVPAIPVVRGELFEVEVDEAPGRRRQVARLDLVRMLRAEKLVPVTLTDVRRILAGRPFMGTLLGRIHRDRVVLVEVAG
ncbi:MAG: hypothetical protein IT352_04085 [Gemmatimonadales bacterium]|nr:hypothetical protein [Gemmatimonadales bacterium]